MKKPHIEDHFPREHTSSTKVKLIQPKAPGVPKAIMPPGEKAILNVDQVAPSSDPSKVAHELSPEKVDPGLTSRMVRIARRRVMRGK